jgi:hypothetical protein
MLGARKHRQMAQQIQEHAARLAAAAPSTYPDGTPFPVSQALGALGHVMLGMRKINHVDAEAIVLRLGWMMALFAEVATTKPTTETIQTLYDTRMWLRNHGMAEGHDIVAQAGLDLHRYWEQNGEVDRMVEGVMRDTSDY